MYKSIYLARRNSTLGPDEFRERWKLHSALTGTTERIRPYFTQVVQCARSDLDGPPDANRDFDGANLLGLVDRSGGYGVFDEPEHRDIMLPDELATFSGPIKNSTLVTREHVCKAGALSRHLVLRFLKFADGTGGGAAFDRWCIGQAQRDGHGPAAELVRRSVANRTVEPAPAGFDFDLVTETWFSDPDALARHSRDANLQAALAGAIGALCDPTKTMTFVAQVNHSRPAIED